MLVRESISFERKRDPKKTLELGLPQKLKDKWLYYSDSLKKYMLNTRGVTMRTEFNSGAKRKHDIYELIKDGEERMKECMPKCLRLAKLLFYP